MAARFSLRALSRSLPSRLASESPGASSLASPRSRQGVAFLGRHPVRPSTVCLRCLFQSTRRPYSSSDQGRPGPPKEESREAPASEQQSSPPASSAAEPGAPAAPASSASDRFSTIMDNFQSRVFVASQALNDLTGYSAIEAIKAENAERERGVAAAQARLHDARAAYKTLTERRASTQREVTTLLARKDSWAPSDLERFTALYRLDHELEAGVGAAATELSEAEADEDRQSAALNAGILKRYHEEQIWSDRIRRQSTWGTWGLMGVNVLLFLVIQFVAEPWKRGRLVRDVADGERALLQDIHRELADIRAKAESTVSPPSSPPAEPAPSSEGASVVSVLGSDQPEPSPWSGVDVILEPARWRPALLDLCSERRIDLRMRDASTIAAEAAVAGAAVATALAFALLRRA